MLRIIDMLSEIVMAMELPVNPLDQLIELMGGASMVAEMTGRKGQLIREDEGNVVYQKRRQDVCLFSLYFLHLLLFSLSCSSIPLYPFVFLSSSFIVPAFLLCFVHLSFNLLFSPQSASSSLVLVWLKK